MGYEYFRRYNQAVVLDANGAPASLKNFKLKMDFKLSAAGLSHTTVAFRAKNEVGTVNSSSSSADRALVSLNPNGYFIGGPTDAYENNAYADHFKQDTSPDVKSYSFNTSTVYTLELHVVGSKITATVYDGSTVVTTFEKETNWTDEGYIVIGGSNAGGYYGNIEITRLDDSGNEVDFTERKDNIVTVDDDGAITVVPAAGYELKAGSLLATDANGDVYVPQRVGFRNGGDASRYEVSGGTAPYTVSYEFVQPTLEQPNIGNIGASYNATHNGLRFISRFTRTVDENGIWWMEAGEIDYEITDYGVLLTSAPGLETTVVDLSVTEDIEGAMVLNSTNQYVQKLSIKDENKYYDICDEHIDMAVTLINIDKVQGYDAPRAIEFYTRPYMVVKISDTETKVLYGSCFNSSYEDVAGTSQSSAE